MADAASLCRGLGCPAAAPDLATPAPDLRLDTLPAPAQLRVCAFLGPGAVPPAASPLWRRSRREAEAAELEALPLPPRRAPWAAELQPASGRAFLALLLPFGLREAERFQSIRCLKGLTEPSLPRLAFCPTKRKRNR